MDNEAYEKEQVGSSQCLHHEEVESSPPPSPPPDYTDAPPEFKADTDIPDVKIITPAAPVEVNLSISELERVRNDSIQEGSSVCACEESNSSCNCRSSTSVTSKTPLTQQVKIIQWTNPKGWLLVGTLSCLAAWVVIFFVLAHFNIL